MAEEFVIRVQLEDGGRSRSAQPRTGPGAEQSTGIDNPSIAEIQQRAFGKGKFNDPNKFEHENRITKSQMKELKENDWKHSQVKKHFGLLESTTTVYDPHTRGFDSFTTQTGLSKGLQGSKGFLNEHRARIRASATIAINSGIQANLAIKAHRSGDSYRNQINTNTTRMASGISSIGIAGAIWGPTAAVAFTANFVISEGARMVTENANWKFDRRMDTEFIHNSSVVAGNISYGRGG